VRRGLAVSRPQAHADIAAGRVLVDGAPAAKPARLVAPGDAIRVLGPPPRFVGRGGIKLDAALARFDVATAGRRAYDLGASTGGFTDCLLQRGAASVVAVDVGYGQLHERLRADARVEVRERTNVRDLGPGDLGPPADVLVADLSFISLRTVLPVVVTLGRPEADLVALVKPQFEAGHEEASRGRGVITDPQVWERVLQEVASTLDHLGAAIMGAMASPLTGADGNVEFLIHARLASATAPAAATNDPAPLLRVALREATAR
jgi:23S rRNA (cytidine1920-2'-O)/16S rRNA (cytidine1409-2'-O)-methyltransferase